MLNRILKLFVLSVLLASCIKERQTGADLAAGDRIPDFTVVMNDGTKVSGSLLRQGVSVIVFFTTQCPDCQETLPHIQQLYDEYASKDVRFALISREDTEDNILSFWKDKGFTMPFSAQANRRIYELFARSRVPRVYICRDGVIKYIFTDKPSIPTYELLSASLEEVL